MADPSTQVAVDEQSARKPPVCLRPFYVTEQPNSPIPLYSGRIGMAQGGLSVVGRGDVKFQWFPQPRVAFTVQEAVNWPGFKLGDVSADLLERQGRAPALLLDLNRKIGPTNVQTVASGHIPSVEVKFSESRLKSPRRIIFHLVNFHDYLGLMIRKTKRGRATEWRGRLAFDAGPWQVRVDSVPAASGSGEPLARAIRRIGGYAITHVGSFERADKKAFSSRSATECLGALCFLFSFMRGFWSPPILPVGLDQHNRPVWERWAKTSMTQFQHVRSWFPNLEIEPGLFDQLGNTYFAMWEDPARREVLSHAMHWYLEANTESLPELSVTVSLIALEMIAWVTIVELGKQISQDGFAKLQASDRVRLLLSQYDIPKNIPDEYGLLRKAAKSHGADDGPEALVYMRNTAVHPNLRKRSKYDAVTGLQAKDLALWYLELCILKLLNYRGCYSDRTKVAPGDDVLPWVTQYKSGSAARL